MPTMAYPHSTAVNSNGGCFYHGGLKHLDLSCMKSGALSGFDRAQYEMAAANVLLNAVEYTARPRKRKLWFGPGGTGHDQDEHQPGGARRTRQVGHRPDQLEQIHEAAEERPTKRARMPSRRAREANGTPREISPAINTGLYQMSGGLQDTPPASPGPSAAVLETVEEIPAPAAPGPSITVLDTIAEDSTPTASGPTNSENPTPSGTTSKIPKAESEQAPDHTVRTNRASKAKATTKAKPTTGSDSDVPPAPGMVRNARGKWVDAKVSARMKNAWKGRVEKGTSGRHGGPPKKETMTKNKRKGVDYGNASEVYRA